MSNELPSSEMSASNSARQDAGDEEEGRNGTGPAVQCRPDEPAPSAEAEGRDKGLEQSLTPITTVNKATHAEEDRQRSSSSGISRLVEKCLKALEDDAVQRSSSTCFCDHDDQPHHRQQHVLAARRFSAVRDNFGRREHHFYHHHSWLGVGGAGDDDNDGGDGNEFRRHYLHHHQAYGQPTPCCGDGDGDGGEDDHRARARFEQSIKLIEAKFAAMALAFKTDRFTLVKRVDIHKHQRDLAESSVNTEIDILRNALNDMKSKCKDVASWDYVDKVQAQLAAVRRATEKAISRAEMYGQVQQENKVFKALEIMISYVENLKRTYECEHAELQDTKRILIENNIVLDRDQVGVVIDSRNPAQPHPGPDGDAAGGSASTPDRTTSSSISKDSGVACANAGRGKKNENGPASSLPPFFLANHQHPRRASIAGVTVLTHMRGLVDSRSSTGPVGGLISAISPNGKLRLLTPRNSSSNLYDIVPISTKASSELALALRLAHAQANSYQRSVSVRMISHDDPRRSNEYHHDLQHPLPGGIPMKATGEGQKTSEDGDSAVRPQHVQNNADLATTVEEDETRDGPAEAEGENRRRHQAVMRRQTSVPYAAITLGARAAAPTGIARRKISTATCRPIHYEESKAKEELDLIGNGATKASESTCMDINKERLPRRRRSSSVGEIGTMLEDPDDSCFAGGPDSPFHGDRPKQMTHHDNLAHQYSERIYPEVMLSGVFGKIQRRNLAAALMNTGSQRTDEASNKLRPELLAMRNRHKYWPSGAVEDGSGVIAGARLFSRSNSCPQPRVLGHPGHQHRRSRAHLRSMQEANEDDDGCSQSSDNDRDAWGDGEESLCCRLLAGHDWLHQDKLHRVFLGLDRILRRRFGVDVCSLNEKRSSLLWCYSMHNLRRLTAAVFLLLAVAFIVYSFFIASN